MAKHFEPSEVVKLSKPSGYYLRDVAATLEHYGFIRLPLKGGHIHFKHREYKDIMPRLADEGVQGRKRDYQTYTLSFPSHSAELSAVYVKLAADACLKVKELNAERRAEENLQPLPEWVSSAIDEVKKEDGSPKFDQREESDALRLFREPQGEARRSYRIVRNKIGKRDVIEVKNLNFPEQAFSYTLVAGARNPEFSFKAMFEEVDERVKAHIADREHGYYMKMGQLIADHGVTALRDDFDSVTVPLLHLTHAATGRQLELLRIPEHETVSDESIAMVSDILAECEDYALEQMEYMEALKKQGWKVRLTHGNEQHAFTTQEYEAIGRGHYNIENARHMEIISADGRVIMEEPAYGELGIVDLDAIERCIQHEIDYPLEGREPEPKIRDASSDGLVQVEEPFSAQMRVSKG